MTTAAPALLSLPETPAGDWDVWLIEGDRATGKTTCGGRWLLEQALAAPEGSLWAVCAPTWDMTRYAMEAALDRAGAGAVESGSTARLDFTLRNKARIKGFSAEKPDSIRGYRLSGAWFDEAGLMRYESFWSDGLMPALRIRTARLVVTAGLETRTALIRDLEDAAADTAGRVRLTVL